MRKLMFGAFMLAAFVLAAGVSTDTVVAQGKDKDKAPVKDKAAKDKDKDKKDAKAGIIEITKGKDDKFRFFVRDSEGKLLAMSGPGGFATPKDAEAAIDHLKEVIGKAKVVAKEKDDK